MRDHAKPDPRAERPVERIVVVHGPDGSFVGIRPRGAHEIAARLRSFSLDEALAAGAPVESSVLLAVRAAQLVAPAQRAQLARFWLRNVERAQAGRLPHNRQVALARTEVRAATNEIAELVAGLLADGPVAARGVAMARALLSTATSPLYAGRRSATGLAAEVAVAVRHLDPAGLALTSSRR